MKNIKEKSNEYAREFVEPFVLYYTEDEVRQFEAQHEDSFKSGAYYVIGEIEKMIPSSDDELENHTKCKSAIFRLQTIIEQLKK